LILKKLQGRSNENKVVIFAKIKLAPILISLIVLILTFNNFAYANENWPTIKEIEADSYIVIDKNTGNILLEKNSAKRVHPASLTKIITAILGLENLDLNKEITVSKTVDSLSDNESKLDLIPGEKLQFQELIYGLLLSSGNDAAVAIAEAVSGNREAFVTLMNKKSKEIGTKNSSWSNPQGITADLNYSTSLDLALITKYAVQNETFKKVVSTGIYSMATTNKHPFSGWNILENTSKLLRFQEIYFASDSIYSISGVKTGTTDAAGSNLISTAHTKNGLELICVINGVRDDNARNIWAYTRTLFEEASKITLGIQPILTEKVSVEEIIEDKTKWYPAESFSLFIGNNPKIDVVITKYGNDIVVKTLAGNKMLFKTNANNASINSKTTATNNASINSNSTASKGQNSDEKDNSIANNESSKTSETSFGKYKTYIVLFLCMIFLFVAGYIIVSGRKPKRKYKYKIKNRK